MISRAMGLKMESEMNAEKLRRTERLYMEEALLVHKGNSPS